MVWRLDRLGRSLNHQLATVEDLSGRGVGFESVHDHVDTTSATGRPVLQVLAALSQFERELPKERITAGLAAARARGSHLGRPTVLSQKLAAPIREMLRSGMSMSPAARITGLARATLYRHGLAAS